MSLRQTLSAMVIGSLVLCGAALAADTYKIDPVHGTVIYRVSHFNVGQAYGRFNNPTGEIMWDSSKPDGQPRRILDCTRAQVLFGFHARTPFIDGLRSTIDWYERFRADYEPDDRSVTPAEAVRA